MKVRCFSVGPRRTTRRRISSFNVTEGVQQKRRYVNTKRTRSISSSLPIHNKKTKKLTFLIFQVTV